MFPPSTVTERILTGNFWSQTHRNLSYGSWHVYKKYNNSKIISMTLTLQQLCMYLFHYLGYCKKQCVCLSNYLKNIIIYKIKSIKSFVVYSVHLTLGASYDFPPPKHLRYTLRTSHTDDKHRTIQHGRASAPRITYYSRHRRLHIFEHENII